MMLYPKDVRALTEPETDILIERCKAGDRNAWEAVIRAYHKRIFAFALSLSGNPADAGDITAEVYVRLLHGLPTFRQDAASFKSWLFRIIRNTHIDVCIRSRNHVPLSLDRLTSLEEPASSYEVVDGGVREPIWSLWAGIA